MIISMFNVKKRIGAFCFLFAIFMHLHAFARADTDAGHHPTPSDSTSLSHSEQLSYLVNVPVNKIQVEMNYLLADGSSIEGGALLKKYIAIKKKLAGAQTSAKTITHLAQKLLTYHPIASFDPDVVLPFYTDTEVETLNYLAGNATAPPKNPLQIMEPPIQASETLPSAPETTTPASEQITEIAPPQNKALLTLQNEIQALTAKISEVQNRLAQEQKALEAQSDPFDQAQQRLLDTIQALSSELSQKNSPGFLDLAKQAFEKLHTTVKVDLQNRQKSISELARMLKRCDAYQQQSPAPVIETTAPASITQTTPPAAVTETRVPTSDHPQTLEIPPDDVIIETINDFEFAEEERDALSLEHTLIQDKDLVLDPSQSLDESQNPSDVLTPNKNIHTEGHLTF